ncbi:MAG TPA: hypothetical protein VMB51_00950 [Solirubrobacteraceae bacterium]|nr:hypothetical protein [Solirubrobacteraceae bacterium]
MRQATIHDGGAGRSSHREVATRAAGSRYASLAEQLRQIIPHEPQLRDRLDVYRHYRDTVSHEPHEFGQVGLHAPPVMERQNGDRGIDGLVSQREPLGARLDYRHRVVRALSDHRV